MASPSRPAHNQELQRLMRDIPNLPSLTTLKHLAHALREDTTPEATLLDLCRPISTPGAEDKSPHPRDRPLAQQYLSGPPRRPATTFVLPQQISPLLRLPNELLLAATTHLDPASAVCLAQSCRHLSGILDYTLPDLRRVALALMFERRQLRRRFRRFAFEATERLDRDRLAVMHGRGMLACAVCVRLHPASAFAPSERGREGEGRRCRASQRRLRFCHTWSLDLRDHGHEGPCTLRVNRRDELVATRRIPVRIDEGAVRLCAHLGRVFIGMGETRGGCDECGVSWTLRVRWEPFVGPERVVEVQRVLKALGHAGEGGFVRWTGQGGVDVGGRGVSVG